MSGRGKERFAFGDYTLDPGTRTLSRCGHDIPLRPRSFDVLAYLVGHAGTLVARDDIVAAVWPGVIASDESLSRCISDVRTALDDQARQIIRTVPGRGYQFAAEVTSASSGTAAPLSRGGGAERPSRKRRVRGLSLLLVAAATAILGLVLADIDWPPDDDSPVPADRASIAVLPFRNISGDSGIDAFATGLTADLNAALARIPEMLVISQSATGQYAGETTDVRRIARELGVGHLLTGTIQGARDRVRIAVQLSEGARGSAVWSHRYDRPVGDFLELQDDIVKQVLTGLQIELTHGEAVRVLSRGTDNLEAWLLNVEGLAEGFEFKRESNLKARDLFGAASKLDPGWAAPVGGIAWTYREAIRRGWSDDVEADRKTWLRLAEKCAETDPQFSGCFIQLGNYHIENGRIEQGIALRERALQLAPSDLSALSGLAWQLVLIGQVKRGLDLLDRARRVSPLHPPWLIATEAYAFQMDRQYDKAIAGFRYALAHGNFPDWHARLAAVYVEAGELDQARDQARLFVEKRPDRKIADLTRILRIQDPQRTRRYAELLRTAGIPD